MRWAIPRLTIGLLFLCASSYAADPVAIVPFKGGDQGRIIVDAKINDQGPFPFLFDTGSVNILSLELAHKLGLNVTGNQTFTAFGGTVETASATLSSIKLGALTLGATQITVIGGGPFTHGDVVGMLGWEFLSKLVTQIDYEHGTLTFYDPISYGYRGKRVTLLLTKHGNNMLTITGTVFGAKASLQLDSGAESPLVLFPGFVQAHHPHSDLSAVTGYGFGGLTRAMVMRAPELTLGPFLIKSPVVHLSTDTAGLENSDIEGNLGGPLLRQFTCIFDVPHNAFYLEPNGWFGRPELTDRSGLVLDTRGPSAQVLYVFPQSPAAVSGIHVGDQLTDADGRRLTDFQWHDLLDGAPGTHVRVTLTQSGKPSVATLTLRDYL